MNLYIFCNVHFYAIFVSSHLHILNIYVNVTLIKVFKYNIQIKYELKNKLCLFYLQFIF